MDSYPEHTRLHAISDVSQAIGEFLEIGLPRMNMEIYERQLVECDCIVCQRGRANRRHDDDEDYIAYTVEGRGLYLAWFPTRRTIQSMLAEYFRIDPRKLDAEKEAMLEAMRS